MVRSQENFLFLLEWLNLSIISNFMLLCEMILKAVFLNISYVLHIAILCRYSTSSNATSTLTNAGFRGATWYTQWKFMQRGWQIKSFAFHECWKEGRELHAADLAKLGAYRIKCRVQKCRKLDGYNVEFESTTGAKRSTGRGLETGW